MTRPAVVLTLPWDFIVSDNEKYGVYRGRKILTKKYRDALNAAGLSARAQVRARDRITTRCALVVTFHEPNRGRVRDVSNYSKLICDALTGTAIDDDGLIDDARYVRGPVDRDNPRVEVEVRAV